MDTSPREEVLSLIEAWKQNSEQKKMLSQEMKAAVERAADVLEIDKKQVAKVFKYMASSDKTKESPYEMMKVIEMLEKDN